MKVCISGVAGFLGSWLAEEFLKLGHEVVGFDNLSGGLESNIPKGVKFYWVDMTSFDGYNGFQYCEVMHDVDLFYHCAAQPYEGVSVFSPVFISENIFTGSINCFTTAIQAGVGRIVYCSSMARYGVGDPPFNESQIPAPQDPYGIAKEAAERTLKVLGEVHGIEWNIAIPHNIYGPRQYYYDPYRNVAAIFANAMLQGIRPIIYGDGKQLRSLSYVTDCINPLVKLGLDENICYETVNIGPDDNEITINELYAKLAHITGFKEEPIYMPERPKEVKIAHCSSNRARHLLDYKTKVDLDTGLQNLVGWIDSVGPKPFNYNKISLEIINDKTPKNWTDHLLRK